MAQRKAPNNDDNSDVLPTAPARDLCTFTTGVKGRLNAEVKLTIANWFLL